MGSKRAVKVGGVTIGGGAPISIQSMCNADPYDHDAVAAQVRQLHTAGCDIIRISVPRLDSVPSAIKVRELTSGIPLVADVHYDHRVAIAMCGHIDKIRINPGTISGRSALRETARALRDTGTPVRIGANSGSLPEGLPGNADGPAGALVEAAVRTVSDMRDLGIEDIVVSVKSSSPTVTTRAYELAASRLDLPLHVGVTESGTAWSGAIRSAAVVSSLLSRGIGDTIRVSLAGSPLPEVRAARQILESIGLRKPGIQVRACPTCGRACLDTESVAFRIEGALDELGQTRDPPEMVIAVMGCVVNGPGEAAGADAAIVGTPGGAVLYIKGRIVLKGTVDQAIEQLLIQVQRSQD